MNRWTYKKLHVIRRHFGHLSGPRNRHTVYILMASLLIKLKVVAEEKISRILRSRNYIECKLSAQGRHYAQRHKTSERTLRQ
jgi:hypothetical protein